MPALLRRLLPQALWTMPGPDRTLYLTFDDGPIPGETPFVLEQLAHYHARMDHGWKARPDARTVLKKKPSSYLKRFFYDTITFDARLLENLIERVGAKQVMLGSDYPYDMGYEDPVGLVESLRGIDEDERARILGGTAARLLQITRRRLPAKA